MLLTSFFRTAGVPAPPLPNPAAKSDDGHPMHWYHGTQAEFYDEDEHDRDPEEHQDPGGKLRTPDTYEPEYGMNAEKHWNTGLGVHFTSLHHVAMDQFAKGRSGGTHARVAHVALHIANPKHYDSEFDMAREAVKYAHSQGHHYLSPEARKDPEVEDHLDGGGEYTSMPHPHGENHEHLGYVDASTSGQTRRVLDNIDRGDEDQQHHDYDHYLRNHPDREEIVEGFKKHLQDKGHGGVTYGNEYEMPKGHRCAISFDDEQIHVKHWQWTHPSMEHLNQARTYGERDPKQPHLVDRNYTPEHGHHWIDPDGKKLGAKAPQKPEYEPMGEGLSDDEVLAHGEAQRKKKNDWQTGIRTGLSLGHHTPREARNAGYTGNGHDQDEMGFDDEGQHGLGWRKMPSTMWHVTTHKSAVLKDGAIKSRDALRQDRGLGLGGGESDTISYTDSKEIAHGIHRGLHEFHSMLNTPLHEATAKMVEESKRMGFHDSVEQIEGKDRIAARLRGHVLHPRTADFMSLDEARKKIHPEAEFYGPHTDPVHGHPAMGSHFTRPATPEEGQEEVASHYKSHTWMRASKGGPMDPLFSSNDNAGFAKMDPKEFAILRVKPKPGAQGYRMGSMSEWRTAHHDAVKIDGVEEPEHHTAGQASGFDWVRGKPPPREDGVYYHGTSYRAWVNIRRDGIKGSSYGLNDRRVWLHSDPERGALVANGFDHPHADVNHTGGGVLLRVKGLNEDELDNRINDGVKTKEGDIPAHHIEMVHPREWHSWFDNDGKPWAPQKSSKIAMPVLPERDGLCYQYAFQHLKSLPEEAHGRLVHGSIMGGKVAHHAWVEFEKDGQQMVHEPTYNEDFPATFYHQNAHPQAEAKYDRTEAAVAMLKHGHYGPWHQGHIEPREAVQTTTMSVSRLLEMALPRTSDAVDEDRVQEYASRLREHGYDEGAVDDEDDHVRILNGRVLNGNHRIHGADEAGVSHLPVEVLQHAEAAILPGYEREHDWLPTGKVFAPSRGGLDPILFGEDRKMNPGVHKVIFERIQSVLEPAGLYDWHRWSRVYLAGSEASEWWGNRDFDTLIGVNYDEMRAAHPEHADLDDDGISDLMNGVFRKDYNDEDWTAPWDGEVWHLTAFVNPDSWDIRRIKPYAAYNMTSDTWAVEPVVVGKDWGPEKWPEGTWDMLESYLALIAAIEKMPHPEQERQGANLYDWLHTDRRRAFSDHGTGWSDVGNVIWKALDLHPSEPLTKLVNWKHMEASDAGETEVSRKWYEPVA